LAKGNRGLVFLSLEEINTKLRKAWLSSQKFINDQSKKKKKLVLSATGDFLLTI
jgi:hypothetical protein